MLERALGRSEFETGQRENLRGQPACDVSVRLPRRPACRFANEVIRRLSTNSDGDDTVLADPPAASNVVDVIELTQSWLGALRFYSRRLEKKNGQTGRAASCFQRGEQLVNSHWPGSALPRRQRSRISRITIVEIAGQRAHAAAARPVTQPLPQPGPLGPRQVEIWVQQNQAFALAARRQPHRLRILGSGAVSDEHQAGQSIAGSTSSLTSWQPRQMPKPPALIKSNRSVEASPPESPRPGRSMRNEG